MSVFGRFRIGSWNHSVEFVQWTNQSIDRTHMLPSHHMLSILSMNSGSIVVDKVEFSLLQVFSASKRYALLLTWKNPLRKDMYFGKVPLSEFVSNQIDKNIDVSCNFYLLSFLWFHNLMANQAYMPSIVCLCRISENFILG